MRKMQDRSEAYASQKMRDLNGQELNLREVIAEAFRDGALAELAEAPLMSPRELVQRAGRR